MQGLPLHCPCETATMDVKEERTAEVRQLIDDHDWVRLRNLVSEWPAPEVADVLREVDKPSRVLLFRSLRRDLASETFAYMDAESRDVLLKELTDEETRHLLSSLTPDDRTELLEELPAQVTRHLLNLLSPEDLIEARNLLGYPEDSVGRLMTPDYVAIRPEWTATEAIEHLRRFGSDRETINVLYVTQRHGLLIGTLELRRLVLAAPQTLIEVLMDSKVEIIAATAHREEAVRMVEHYDLNVLPVVDSGGTLLGIITVDDVLDVAEEEATEDIQRMGGMEALDAPYIQVGLFSMVRKRGGWLAALFLGEMLTATAMAFFEHEIARAVVLALFIPLIISSGGNSGSQAASLIIRALALQELRLRDWFRVIRREIAAGLLLGSLLGSIGFIRVMLWQRMHLTNYGVHYQLIALTVAFSLIGVVMFGTIAGSMLPFVMRRLGFDPATSSTPFVATLVDVTGLIIYFTIAQVILKGSLL